MDPILLRARGQEDSRTLASARRRMGALEPEDFVTHTGVVYAVAADG